MWLRAIVSVVLALEVSCSRSFPPGFRFGAATAAYQIEGAWNVSDKSESIWDRLVHTRPGYVADGSNADVACDSYHLWEEDIKLVHGMGLDFYRFSISWPRLLPTGLSNYVSAYGCAYYGALIAGLRARGVAPVVTLYHWDLPQSLQDLGGWANPLIVDWFADYARVVFSLFAGQVSTWITMNEPCFICDGGYRDLMAPGIKVQPRDRSPDVYKNVLLAHATVYKIYDEEFKPKYGGEVSIANQEFWFEPETDSDWELTQLAREYAFGRYAYPIFSASGGWPPLLEEYMAEKSRREGYSRSRLPALTPDEISFIKGSYDFLALNHYTSRTIRAVKPGEELGPYLFDSIEELGVVAGSRGHWPTAKSDWLKVNPQGLYNNLNLTRLLYGDVKILITENGYSDSGHMNDTDRISYMHAYLEQVLLAIQDGVNVVGYTAWSLMDNFEWSSGYGPHFGLHAVDFSDPRRRRRPKASVAYYKNIITTRSLDVENAIIP